VKKKEREKEEKLEKGRGVFGARPAQGRGERNGK